MTGGGAGVRGYDGFVASLDVAARELAGLAPTEAGELIVTAGARNAPHRTGYLSAHHEAIVTAGRVDVVNTADYAAIVNARNPWLPRTLDELTDQLVDLYAADVASVVAKINGV
jgi:hypothetical protein